MERAAFDCTIDTLLRGRADPACVRICIGGGSGAGKSTICALIRAGLPAYPVQIVSLDRYFKPVEQLPTYYSHYHRAEQPDFNTPVSLQVAEMLASCREAPAQGIVIYDGHFALYYAELRALADIRCFVDCDRSEMLVRRTERNLAAGYGGSRANILAYNRECVLPRYEQFIYPTKRSADIVIDNSSAAVGERDALITLLCAKLARSLHGEAGDQPLI